MILKNAAVRHGRALVSPISRSALRQLSTQTPSTTEPPASTVTQAPEATAAWAASQALKSTTEQPQKVKSGRRKQAKYAQDHIHSLGVDSSASHQGRSWSDPHKIGDVELSAKEQWKKFQRIQKATTGLGTEVERKYSPSSLVINPPAPEDISLELLMASQTHMGHHTSIWNPANARYIYGVREKIHIIGLETTAAHLRRAARVVEEVAYRGGVILFVGTRKGQMEVVTKAAEMAGGCHVFTKWAPGSITNRDVMLKGHDFAIVNEKDESLDGFEIYKQSSRPLLPDLVVCLNPMENYTLLYECGLKTIPTIGIIDTDADPTWVTYAIPANDDSLRSVGLIAGVLGRSGQRGQQRRKRDTTLGEVPFQTPQALKKYMGQQRKEANTRRKEVMGQEQQAEGFTKEEERLIRSQYAQEAVEEVNEDQMLKMMGITVGEGEAKAEVGADSLATPSVQAIEEQLDAVTAKIVEFQATVSGQTPTSKASAGKVAEKTTKLNAQSIEDELAAVAAKTAKYEEVVKGHASAGKASKATLNAESIEQQLNAVKAKTTEFEKIVKTDQGAKGE